MRPYLLLSFLLAPFVSFAQKMLESSEWCPHKHSPAATNTFLFNDGRSDSLDILHTHIALNLLGAPQISAACTLDLLGKVNGIHEIRLDLEIPVDSVVSSDGAQWNFTMQGQSVLLTLPQALNTGEALTFTVYYHGIPPKDATGWGGGYNSGGYTFNLGVGFDEDPHSFGRAWFPCFDNFVERSTLQVDILSAKDKPGYSNGVLLFEQTTATTVERSWSLSDPIPSYLACYASGPYTSFKRTYPGEAGAIPVDIAATVADTNKVRNSFVNLPKAIEAFEYWFGPYQWDKIGYSLVPFNSGAMEHATNIAIGRDYINGALTYETLWAHELSHHWWGDLATCSTAEDMWLNEGWASYSEHLFTEKVYGKTAFQNAVRANHLNVLQNVHIQEGGYLAVSGVPHSLTYSNHVYKKGASVAHNLRGYLGDSLFQVGCRAAMAGTHFTDWSSEEFRDKLEAATGKNLHDFFNDWVFAGGYPDFSVDSMQLIFSPVDAPTIARVFVKQKLRGAPHFHQNVPLEFSFMMNNGERRDLIKTISGENSVVEFTFPAFGPSPKAVFVNTNLKLLQARSEGEKMIKATGAANFSEAKMSLSVNSLGADSVFLRVEHHFAAPDNLGANPNGYALSNRYWSVLTNGNPLPSGFDAQATVVYNGGAQGDQLDTELFAATPDTQLAVVLYRPGAGHPWQEWPTYTRVALSVKTGQLRIMHVAPGEYTIAKNTGLSAAPEVQPLGLVQVSPNPTNGNVRVKATELFDSVTLRNAEGKLVKTWYYPSVNEAMLDLKGFPAGQYWLQLQGKKGRSVVSVLKQ